LSNLVIEELRGYRVFIYPITKLPNYQIHLNQFIPT
jgi:hypothetical protein